MHRLEKVAETVAVSYCFELLDDFDGEDLPIVIEEHGEVADLFDVGEESELKGVELIAEHAELLDLPVDLNRDFNCDHLLHICPSRLRHPREVRHFLNQLKRILVHSLELLLESLAL